MRIASRMLAAAALVAGQALVVAAGPTTTEADVRATMQALASPAMRGRGSATEDERRAADYLATRLQALGVKPAGDEGSFIQQVELHKQSFSAAPTLSAGTWTVTHGKGFVVSVATAASISGPLLHWKEGMTVTKGAVVLLPKGSRAARDVIKAGANLAIYSADPRFAEFYPQAAQQLPELPVRMGPLHPGDAPPPASAILLLDEASTTVLAALADGTPVSFAGSLAPDRVLNTRNVLGLIPGSDATRAEQVVMLSAHFDHLGVDPARKGDQIFDGADDDASGVTAVLELTRALAGGTRPKRTVLVALFGSEELGLIGSQFFLDHPPVALDHIAANLEFEMIGRPDKAVADQTLWLTGYGYSNLGPELARQGARLVADPHPEMNFFQRSDNFALVQRGVIAQTVSSYGLHPEYHQPNDDLEHIDFAHMARAIASLQAPVRWLVDSDFVPKWNPGALDKH